MNCKGFFPLGGITTNPTILVGEDNKSFKIFPLLANFVGSKMLHGQLSIYSCDFFVEPKWKLGNLMNDRLIDMLNSPKQTRFGKMKSQLSRKCRTCQWYPHCFGGCTKDRIKDPQDSGMPRFCKSTIMFMEHAHPVFQELARQWKEQQKDIAKGSVPGKNYNAFEDFMGKKF